MKLHFAPGACSLAPHIAACELDLKLELVGADFGAELFKVNPKGQVPALELDDGQVLTEAPAILMYLADLKFAAELAPPHGEFQRYRVLEWLAFISSELHKGYGNPKHSDESAEVIARRLTTRFGLVNAALAEQSSGWLTTTFSVADIYLYVVSRWLELLGLDMATWPALAEHFARVQVRPATQAALQAEGLGG